MTLAHFLGLYWDIKEVYAINASSYSVDRTQSTLEISNIPHLSPKHQQVLVVDEIIDSGKSFLGVLRVLKQQYPQVLFKSATLFAQKSARFKADFVLKEAKCWIDFFLGDGFRGIVCALNFIWCLWAVLKTWSIAR
ncbi:xanthine guanine phosphoribosyl transferase (gpt) [Helicobacter bizzozeronii CCUG 35545]|nr:xanthine guanine phosphoribosyl transferase (gpt) [Helicobacter bizzozeronii CCUG 35545]